MPATKVPFAAFDRGVGMLRGELRDAIERVLTSGWFILGPEVRAFEAEFAEWCGARDAVGVASGTDAIELALRALGIGSGDEVVTQANTCVPTVAAIVRAGATPVLCDVRDDTATIDADSLAAAVGPRTRAVVPVHLYGQVGEIDAVLEVARQRGLAVVEDCAQAHGALADGRPAGTFGAVGCFSFYPTKNLGALGDAGAVVTRDLELAERLRLARQYGQADRYRHVAEGVNSRMDELQAGILRVKLPHLHAWNERRMAIARSYAEALEGTPVEPLRVIPGRSHVFHLFVVRAPDRDGFRSRLQESGVTTLVHYPYPVHAHEPYRSLGRGPVPLHRAERLAADVVSLPIYPELTDHEVGLVAESAREAATSS